MHTFGDKILDFLFHLNIPFKLPPDVEVLDVHSNEIIQDICRRFYHKFYDDQHKRRILVGINPGRFGGGITGIPFTDPKRLQDDCGIENDFPKRQELSCVFMYEMMNAFGGVDAFYKQFYISALSPLGFVKHGKNLNYYDDKLLFTQIEPFVVECIEKQLDFGIETNIAYCIGEGENYKYFQKLNKAHGWFDQIIPLAHPRFILQYKRKFKEDYIKNYVDKLLLSLV